MISNNPKESSFGLRDQGVCEKIGDIFPKTEEVVKKFVQHLNERDGIDDDKLTLRWSLQK